jgi:5-methylcytosine-specific restriction endonuclease McrA
VDQVTKNGLCRPHENEQYRDHYARGGKVSIAQRAHARKRGIAPLPLVAQEYLLEQFEGKCAYCGIANATTWDHILPISLGGETEPGNIVPACVACNSSKKNLDLFEWLNKKGMLLRADLLDVLALMEL